MTVQNSIGRAGGATFDGYWGLPPIQPGGRLSLSATQAIFDSVNTGVNVLAYHPYRNNLVPYWSATRQAWGFREFSIISTLLSGVATNSVYDVFLNYNEATNTSALVWYVWTNATTRNASNAPTFYKGVLVRKDNPADLWLGTFRGAGSNLAVDSEQFRLLYNGFNQVGKVCRRVETREWHNGAGWTNWFGGSSNRLHFLNGDPTGGSTTFTVKFSTRVTVPTTITWGSQIKTAFDQDTHGALPEPTTATDQGIQPAGLLSVTILPVINTATVPLGYHYIQPMVNAENADVWFSSFGQCGIQGVWTC